MFDATFGICGESENRQSQRRTPGIPVFFIVHAGPAEDGVAYACKKQERADACKRQDKHKQRLRDS